MSDTLAGLTRRVHAFTYDRDTLQELSYIVDDARDAVADSLIELGLRESGTECEDEDGALVAEDLLDDEQEEDESTEGENLDALEDELDALADDAEDIEDDEDDEDELTEATLALGEFPVV